MFKEHENNDICLLFGGILVGDFLNGGSPDWAPSKGLRWIIIIIIIMIIMITKYIIIYVYIHIYIYIYIYICICTHNINTYIFN